jgi:TPR repeat protein
MIGLAVAAGTGRGTDLDQVRSLMWWKRAANAGSPAAMLVMAAHCEMGLGVIRDAAAAEHWYAKARVADVEPMVAGGLVLALPE